VVGCDVLLAGAMDATEVLREARGEDDDSSPAVVEMLRSSLS